MLYSQNRCYNHPKTVIFLIDILLPSSTVSSGGMAEPVVLVVSSPATKLPNSIPAQVFWLYIQLRHTKVNKLNTTFSRNLAMP